MSFEMTLWRVVDSRLEMIAPAHLEQERRLEDWIAKDPSILELDIAIIGRQVQTDFRGRIDLLALDRNANCVILELKRGRTPREVVAQLLDYGAWVKDLGYSALDQIAQRCMSKTIRSIFHDAFGETIPETVNASHNLIVVASALDDSSERIISYLSEEYDVSINAVFFTFFRENNAEFLGRAWLRDPIETIERSEARKRAPWSGYWFVNVGEGEYRNWDDNRQYRLHQRGPRREILSPSPAPPSWRQDLRVHEGLWVCGVRGGCKRGCSHRRFCRRRIWKGASRTHTPCTPGSGEQRLPREG